MFSIHTHPVQVAQAAGLRYTDNDKTSRPVQAGKERGGGMAYRADEARYSAMQYARRTGTAALCCRVWRWGCGTTSARRIPSAPCAKRCARRSTAASLILTLRTITALCRAARRKISAVSCTASWPPTATSYHCHQSGLPHVARPLWQRRRPKGHAGQPGPKPCPHAAELCGYFLFAPHGPGHPSGRNHGCAGQRRAAGQGAVCRAFEL